MQAPFRRYPLDTGSRRLRALVHAIMVSTSPSIASGILLGGKYRIERTLGEGGMGVVLAAMNEALRQRVAIKLLRTGSLANAKALGRFEREARAAAQLRSEHVARVLDVGKFDDGRPFMVMEFLEGQDLGHVVDQRKEHLPIEPTIEWVLQACEAVAEAHALGIVHRDLKPSNLFLTTTADGRACVKVLDFGISKVESEEAENMSLTKTTEVIGSPSYMSPEQLKASRDVDARTDIWALGVILYELVTGKLPFYAESVTALVAVVMTDDPTPIEKYRDGVPPALSAAIMKCLSRKREDRFQSVVELASAIAPYASSQGASMADRVRGVVAQRTSGPVLPPSGSSGALPPSPTGSVHAAETVAMDPKDIPLPVLGPNLRPPSASSSSASSSSSSARLHVHAGTSVAWGETQVDDGVRAPPPRAKWPLAAAAVGLVVVLGGAGTGAIVYVKRASAKDGAAPTTTTATTSAAPPATSNALPEGRKDLPPLASGAPASPASAEAPVASSLPTTRGPTSTNAKPPTTKPTGRGTPKNGGLNGVTGAAEPIAPPPSPAAPPAPPPKGPDDLSNIGRR